MKKLLIAAVLLPLSLGAANCPQVNTASSVVSAAAQSEVDRAYKDFAKVLDRVDARNLTPGSVLARQVATDIYAAEMALKRSDLAGYRAAEARINTEIGG